MFNIKKKEMKKTFHEAIFFLVFLFWALTKQKWLSHLHLVEHAKCSPRKNTLCVVRHQQLLINLHYIGFWNGFIFIKCCPTQYFSSYFLFSIKESSKIEETQSQVEKKFHATREWILYIYLIFEIFYRMNFTLNNNVISIYLFCHFFFRSLPRTRMPEATKKKKKETTPWNV